MQVWTKLDMLALLHGSVWISGFCPRCGCLHAPSLSLCPVYLVHAHLCFLFMVTLISLHYFLLFLLLFPLIPHSPSIPIPPFFWLSPASSVLCHLPRQGWALPSSPSHPSRLPGSGSGGSGPGRRSRERARRPRPPTSSPQASRLQRCPAEEQTPAEPRSERQPGWGSEVSCQPPASAPGGPEQRIHTGTPQTCQHLPPSTGPGWQRRWYLSRWLCLRGSSHFLWFIIRCFPLCVF